MMEYLRWKMRLSHSLRLEHAEYLENISVFCLFVLHVVWRRVAKAPFAGNSFETEAKHRGESGRPSLSVGTCIHVNYLLVVQQEMRNDNKLGKEKQKNKQMLSQPLVHFFLSPLFNLRQSAVSDLRPTTENLSLKQRQEVEQSLC